MLFIEWDDKSREWQVNAWKELGLPEPSMQVDSGVRSIHNYWVLAAPISPAKFKDLQKRLAKHSGSDSTLCNPSRVMRLPGTARGNGQPVSLIHANTNKYDLAEFELLLPAPVERGAPTRTLTEIRDALSRIPPRVPGTGTYPSYRNLLWGLIAAVEEAGGKKDQAIALMEDHSPQWRNLRQVAESGGEKITAATFWYCAKEHGYELKSTSQNFRHRLDPTRKEIEQRTYSELIDELLDATVRDQSDEAMPLRAELITRFRVTGAQVESALFQLQIQRESQRKTTTPPPSLDLSRISGMDYLVDGFIIENDQNLIWGAAGTGKTTNAIGLAKAVIYGERFLDHDKTARRGAVLFIASDSGPAPLKGAIQDFGLAEDPEFNEGPSKRFHVWASDQDQGMAAWSADLRGCIRLLNFIREFGISLVIIDSCKAVLAGTDIEYTDNRGVTALMTFFKEVICPHTTVVWLNHDGAKVRGGDCPAGAKAWKEIPSAVHTIEVPRDEETKQPVKTHRKWIVQKNRLGETREFLYRFGDGELSVLHGQTTYGNCLAELVEGMATKFRESGLETSSKQDLYRMCPNHAAKTVSNTLVTAARAKHPEICRRGRGLYALSPRILESLRSVNPEVGRNFSKSKSETTISEIPSSSQPQNSGTSRDKREIPTIPDESHREKDEKTEIHVRQGGFKEFIPAGHTHLIAPSSSPAQIGSGADAMTDEGDDPHWGPRQG